MANPNLELLISVARLLRPLLDELVFVGGCTTALLITDPAAAEVRSTYDVDAIAEITSYAEYAAFSERLRQLGLQKTMAKERRFAGGPMKICASMSCPRMREF